MTSPMLNEAIRILVAEDNEDHLFLTVRALNDVEGVHLEVDAVKDGEEALDYIHRRGRFADRERPHLILLDIKMPRIGGFEVLMQLKSDPELRSIPVVVLTSSENQEDVETTYRLGGNSFVSKPAGMAGMREGIRGLADYWVQLAQLPEPPR
ncbi:MAG TPA: response regulator [Actinomycetota bacterium]|jgi:CheY-like chemotaxis protein|nr:response regulator [Actinomycetota bacterium]